jgi:RNA polymerase sigma factor (sigma-70 family)
MRDRIERLLDGVPEEDRKIFELLSKGFNQSEIARMLGVTRAAVSRRVNKVRRYNDVKNRNPR